MTETGLDLEEEAGKGGWAGSANLKTVLLRRKGLTGQRTVLSNFPNFIHRVQSALTHSVEGVDREPPRPDLWCSKSMLGLGAFCSAGSSAQRVVAS